MKHSLYALIAILSGQLAFAGQPGKPDLNVRWTSISNEHNGRPDPNALTMTIDNSAASLSFMEGGEEQIEKYVIRIDWNAAPKTIDFVREDRKTFPGIFKLEAGTLTLCMLTTHDAPRPRDFVSRKGDGRQLMRFTRRD
jgi:uncharacterized protein (TIGR03067 family)